MKIFIDSADVSEVSALVKSGLGLIDGVTTNPSLIAQSGASIHGRIKELCAIVDGPVSAEVTATSFEGMLAEGKALAAIAKNVAVKVPLTEEGLRCCHVLSREGTAVNVTLCFSSAQALLAAKAGASFISPFVGRLDDIGHDGLQLVEEILDIYRAYDFATEVLVASVRHTGHVTAAARLGAHVATLPPKVFRSLYGHPLTDKGLRVFLDDWEKTKQTIL